MIMTKQIRLNKHWKLNIRKVINELNNVLDIEKYVKDNNIDIIKFLYYNEVKFDIEKTFFYAIKYKKIDVLKFIHINCSKLCKNISKIDCEELHEFFSENCENYCLN